MLTIFETTLQAYFWIVIAYFILVNLVQAIFLVLSFTQILEHMRHNSFSDYRIMVQSELTPPVSILVPAYNEAPTIVESVKSLLKLSYGRYEVVVINDGSNDGTLERLVTEFEMYRSKQVYYPQIDAKRVRSIYKSRKAEYKNLVIVDKENGGKADALNAGINVARFDYLCAIDADSLLEDDALQKVMKPFLRDERVIAAGGIVRIANGCKVANGRVVQVGLSNKLLPIIQVVEYFRAFLSARMAWTSVNGLLIISGAFGLFKREAVIEAGGYTRDTVGEDMELVTRMHRTKLEKKQPYRIAFVPDPVCWTEVPESPRILGRQRNRWQRGLLETFLLHKKMLLKPQYGVVGLAAMPYFLLIELLGPAIEFFGYVATVIMLVLGILSLKMAILFFIVALFYGIMFSVGAVLLEEISFQRYPHARDLALLLSVAVIENLGYRQITAWWRVQAFYDYLRGVKSWGVMQRKGFAKTKS